MAAIEFLDRPPSGWFVLDVMHGKSRFEWAALMVDYDPDLENRPPVRRECWVRIAGKYRSRDAAWDALNDMMTTRH